MEVGITKVLAKDTVVIDGIDNLAEIMKTSVDIVNVESKISYNKVLAKADVIIKIMYLTEDNRINTVESKIPVMGFVDIANVTDENICNIKNELKNLVIKPNNVEEHSIYVEAEIEFNLFVYQNKSLELIQDLYSPSMSLNANCKKVNTMQEKKVIKDICNIREKQVIPEIRNEKIYDVDVNVEIKKQNISVNQTIYLDTDDLAKYLLFGTTESQAEYTVKAGDTISSVAYNNKMSSDEFLLMNPEFKNENALLYAGQNVKIGILNPQFNIVQEDEQVSLEEQKYSTETRYDNSKNVGYQQVEQAGVNGVNKVTQKIRKINGETTNIVTTNTEQIKPVTNEIVIKGGKQSNYTYSGGRYGTVIATKGQWGWPASCSSVSSGFGYRWGTLHDGTDIAGCGYGSNIFAAEGGTVVESKKKPGRYPGGYGDNGEYIIIDHHNGFYTIYAHLCPGCRYVSAGDNVSKGQVIGGMGHTGAATGTHLHFGLWSGYPYRGGRALNAMSVY